MVRNGLNIFMDQARFLEFLRKGKILKSENKSLYEFEKSEYSELTSYKIVLKKQIYYENRFQYIDLVRKCINNYINCYRFQWDFFEIYQNDMQTFDK